ncbi:MAG: extracellular solute-binding protein [Lachnospiraceae bacterium]|nr:extracellular solute-binding protein [Lachnospiraceae bacterium]
MKKELKMKVLFFGILFAVLVGILLFYYRPGNSVLKVGIFYGSNWEVPGTVHYDIFDQAIEKYKKEYGNIEIEYEEGIPSKDYSEWLAGKILEGDEPDVYLVMDEDFYSLVSVGALKNLDLLLSDDSEADCNLFYQSACQAGEYQGKQYALPMECNPTLMFVNKTLLKKEGIEVPDHDWTWDDFYEICKEVTKDSDGDGRIDQFGYCDYTWIQAVYSNGIRPFNEDGTESYFTDERFIESIQFVKKLQQINDNYLVSSNDFDLGKVVFRPLSFSDYRTYMPYPWRIKKYSDFEWNCIPMPSGPEGDNISSMDVLMAGISARTTKTREAWQFLKMLTMDEEIQSLVYADTSGASALKAVSTSQKTMELLNKDTPGGQDIDMSLLDQTIEQAVIPEKFKTYHEVYEKADNDLSALLMSEDDISTSMFNLKNEIDKMIQP